MGITIVMEISGVQITHSMTNQISECISRADSFKLPVLHLVFVR